MPPVTPQIEELRMAYLMGLVEQHSRQNRRYSLENLFPAKTRDGTRWTLDIVTAGRGRGLVKPLNAPTSLIGPDKAKEMYLSPFHFGEKMALNDEEMSTLRAPGTDNRLDKAAIVDAKVAKLIHRWRALRQYSCAQALSAGALTFADENGVSTSINYGIGALSAVSASWGTASTKIAQDIQGWISEFFETNGVMPQVVIFNPTKVKEYFLKNTELQAWLGKFQRTTAESFFASAMRPDGAYMLDLFGLTWIPIVDVYETTDGDESTQTYCWGQDILTFIAAPEPGEKILEFMQSRTAQTDRTGGPVVDSIELQEPKAQVHVRCHANGLPAILTEKRVMRVADLTP